MGRAVPSDPYLAKKPAYDFYVGQDCIPTVCCIQWMLSGWSERTWIFTNSQEGNWNNQGYGDIDANENMKSIVVNGDFRAFFAAIPFLQWQSGIFDSDESRAILYRTAISRKKVSINWCLIDLSSSSRCKTDTGSMHTTLRWSYLGVLSTPSILRHDVTLLYIGTSACLPRQCISCSIIHVQWRWSMAQVSEWDIWYDESIRPIAREKLCARQLLPWEKNSDSDFVIWSFLFDVSLTMKYQTQAVQCRRVQRPLSI